MCFNIVYALKFCFFKLTFTTQFFMVITVLHYSEASLYMLVPLDDILVKSLQEQYNKDHAIKLFKNISTYDFQFRRLVHKFVNNDRGAEPAARNFVKHRLPKFTNIGCTDEEFKKKYGWPDAAYECLHRLFQKIETLKEIFMTHYYSTWEITTGVTTIRTTRVTRSAKEIAEYYLYQLQNNFPTDLSYLFEITPKEKPVLATEYLYYGHVDYDNSL